VSSELGETFSIDTETSTLVLTELNPDDGATGVTMDEDIIIMTGAGGGDDGKNSLLFEDVDETPLLSQETGETQTSGM